MTENETIEFKKSLAQLKEGVISLSSMLNKSGKGVVYFRIKDSGDIFGLTIGKKALADITHKIQNNLKPLPNNLQIEPMRMEEKQVIRILAQGKRILEGER